MSAFSPTDLAFFGLPAAPVFGAPGMGGAGTGGAQYWKFFSKEQQERLERIRGARLLFNGLHRQYFLDEQRTQFRFPSIRLGGIWGDTDRILYETFNVLGLISHKGADLLFGDEPILRVAAPGDAAGGEAYVQVQEEAQRAFLGDLVKRCNLASLFHRKAEDASCDDAAFFEAQIIGDQVWLTDVPGEEIFPVGRRGPDDQYAQYDRFTVGQVPTADPNAEPIYLLLITHYRIGSIDRELWRLHDGQKSERLSIDQWPLDPGDEPLQEHVETGIDENTIIYVPNQIRHGKAVSDYSADAIQLQDTLNAKNSQLAWVIAQHAQPKISRHMAHADDDGNTRADYSVEYNQDQANASKYITWDAHLEGADKDRDFTLVQLLVATESSATLLGISLGNGTQHATAFKSFRLMAANAIAKAARKSNYQKGGISRALTVCCKLAQRLGKRFDIYPIGVQLRDGIPLDGLEEAQRISTLRSCGSMSVKRSVYEQINEPADAQDELDELKEETAAQTPSILLQPPTAGGEEQGVSSGPTPQEQEQESAAAAAAGDLEVAA
jgi:hypothetical protein